MVENKKIEKLATTPTLVHYFGHFDHKLDDFQSFLYKSDIQSNVFDLML